MNEITLFSSNHNPDPYAPPSRNYMTADEIYETLREISGGEEENALYEIVPSEIWERYAETTCQNEEVINRQKFYYQDQAQYLLEQVSYDNLWKINLAIYKVGGWECGGYQFEDIIAEALGNEEAQRLLNFKSLFIKSFDGVIPGVKKNYAGIIENWAEELHELDKYIYDKLWAMLLKSVGEDNISYASPAMVIAAKFRDFSTAINKKIQGLDLLEYIGFMATARQVCQGYDRYIQELQATIAMHGDLKRYYQMKEQKLVAEYKEKEAALTARYAALLVGAEKKDG
jgi:hypothetical protein